MQDARLSLATAIQGRYMKILIVNSSNRSNGNTNKVAEAFKDRMLSDEHTVESVHLSGYNIKTCLGCRACFDNEETTCPLKDDIQVINQKIENSDLIIMATPIYVEDVNGIMKNFIDRLAYNCHRPHYVGKYGYIIATSGLGTSNHAVTTITRALQTWGMNVLGSSKYICGARIEKSELYEKYMPKIEKEIGGLKKQIRKKGIPFLSILVFKIQQKYYWKRMDPSSYDYKYWEGKGWLDKNRNFYTDRKANRGKVFLAKILGEIISLFVLT
jgi:multimeric flavodoxin WrbA